MAVVLALLFLDAILTTTDLSSEQDLDHQATLRSSVLGLPAGAGRAISPVAGCRACNSAIHDR